MYTALNTTDLEEFKKCRFVVFDYVENENLRKSGTDQFNIFVGNNKNAFVDKKRPLLSGFYSEQDRILILKNIFSPVKDKLEDDLSYFRVFCDMVIEEFILLGKSRNLTSLIIHTNEEILLESLFSLDFKIKCIGNKFYKAFKSI